MDIQQLDHGWLFRDAADTHWRDAEVPGCVHIDLQRHGLIPDPFWGSNERLLQPLEEKDWVYRLDFTPGDEIWQREHIELCAPGLDTVARLSLNGTEIATVDNMFIEHRFDVKASLKKGTNRLEIHFSSPMKYIRTRLDGEELVESCDPVGGSSRIRKQACSFGWDWGPRLATSGIWKPVFLQAWSGTRFESVQVVQKHTADKVELTLTPRMAGTHSGSVRGEISLRGKHIASVKDNRAVIESPEIWWPAGQGEQPLYEVKLEWIDPDGKVQDSWQRRIGLRTIELDRHPDEHGESFQFVVNGRPLFAKGANWIPADSFVTRVDRARYEQLLDDAVSAHMNMIRVWGGGIYEQDTFYDLCDEKGLLVWQDFMFACALYPGDKEFLDNVHAEAVCQVQRLRHHACLALWCGNNELEQLSQDVLQTEERRHAYESLFYDILPRVLKEYDTETAYWPSSPHNPDGYEHGHNNEAGGDAHFWDVWHMRKPVNEYEKKRFRFCSEFGMQSYCSPEVALTFCPPEELNIFSPTMENHQKNSAGNQIIFDYISRLFRFPRDYRALSYLSQLNQAHCMKVGVEHFRRCMPHTMGALYWQLNDCWPVASWSSIEYSGKWKALHYEAKRFFAPALLSVKLVGEESLGKNNTRRNSITGFELHTVYDAPDDDTAELYWSLETMQGKVLRESSRQVSLRHGESICQQRLDFSNELTSYDRAELFLRAELCPKNQPPSIRTGLFTSPRFLSLLRETIEAECETIDSITVAVHLHSPVFQACVQLDFPGLPHRCSDNYIDLYPGRDRTIEVHFDQPVLASEARKLLTTYSLIDSY